MSSSLLGTAGEAWQIHQYHQLCDKYGTDTANQLIKHQLDDRGISLSKFKTYLEVKQEVQNGMLNVRAARKEAEDLARQAVDSAFD